MAFHGKLRDHIRDCVQESDAKRGSHQLWVGIFAIGGQWRHGMTSWAQFRYLASLVCDVMRWDTSMYGLEHPTDLGRWLYLHSDEFWAPVSDDHVWHHLQYIYDEYMAKPEVRMDMWSQSLAYVQRHPPQNVLSKFLWDKALDQMIDEAMDEFDAV